VTGVALTVASPNTGTTFPKYGRVFLLSCNTGAIKDEKDGGKPFMDTKFMNMAEYLSRGVFHVPVVAPTQPIIVTGLRFQHRHAVGVHYRSDDPKGNPKHRRHEGWLSKFFIPHVTARTYMPYGGYVSRRK
jgi:hypothetical protein